MKDFISKFRINPDSDLGKQMIKSNIRLEDAIGFEYKPEMIKTAGHYYNGIDLEPWKQSYFATGRADIVFMMISHLHI